MENDSGQIGMVSLTKKTQRKLKTRKKLRYKFKRYS